MRSRERSRRATWVLLAALCLVPPAAYYGTRALPAAQQDKGNDAQRAVQDPADAIPVRRVVLFSSGVGYIERAGTVEGDVDIPLQFRADDVNDLLKSLIVEDLDGGQITAVNYTSRDPVTRTLRSFALDLTENPSLFELLKQLRGEPVVLYTTEAVEGTVVSVEEKEFRDEKNDLAYTRQYANLFTAHGLVSVPIDQVQHIEVKNERIRQELAQALEVLATAHDTQKKTVLLRCRGEGKRRIRVGYVRELPVWKTTYRLAVEGERALLQGWAIVDNTTDEDWKQVAMALVSGRPVSFRMNLYEPIYAQRPEVQLRFDVAVRPPMYEGALAGDRERIEALERKAAAPRPQRAGGRGLADARAGGYPGMGGFAAMEGAAAMRRMAATAAIAATGATVGEQFQYVIKHPVDLPRQQSALLPIVSSFLEDLERVSIYNQNTHRRHPMRGLRFTNTTGAHLMRGPITVYDEGSYAGDAQIDDTPAGMSRLVAYALDTDLEIESKLQSSTMEIVAVKIVRGALVKTHRLVRTTVYRIRNRSDRDKTLIIEQPITPTWKLIEPAQPAEQTASFYRFRVDVAANESKQFAVRESSHKTETVQLAKISPEQVLVYIRMPEVREQVKKALQQFLALQSQLAEIRAEKARLQAELQRILQDQKRIRENLAAIDSSSTLAKNYLKKLQDQESLLESIYAKVREQERKEAEQSKKIEDFLRNLNVE